MMKEDWKEVELGDITELNPGLTNKDTIDKELEVQFLPMKLVEEVSNKIHLNETRKLYELQKKSYTYFAENDVLFAKVTPCMENGKMAIAKNLKNSIGYGSSEFHVFRCSKIVVNSFLFYYLVRKAFRSEAQHNMTGAVGLRRVPKYFLEKHEIPLPPLPIQRAIVSKIETLFSDLDKGIADLKKAQEQLKIYRQAVLKKAFEGELTKEWREKQTDLPTAAELLEQIKEERQKHYEQQLEEWKQAVKAWEENGKEGKKPGKPSVYKIYNSPMKSLSLNLPANWLSDCIGNTCSKTEYGSSAKSSDVGNIPVIRMGNLQNGKIDWSDLKFSSNKSEIKQYMLRNGDILFNRTNSPELVGKTAQYKGERPAIFAGYLIRLNQIDSIIDGSYLNYYLNSHPAKVYGAFVKTDGVNQSNINGEKLSNYPIPLCSIQEQHQIVREIESRLSVCDKVEQNIAEALEKSEALRQSILKKAFEGKLLSLAEIEACKWEADYEPASVLLERIKKEKAG